MQDSIRKISPGQMHEFIKQGGNFHLVDVRSVEEFSSQHVVGAANLPIDHLNSCSLAEKLGEESGKDVTLFLMCASGIRSEMAANKLASQGLNNIATVDGGTNAWSAARLPLTGGRRMPTLEQQVQNFLGIVILLALFKASIISPLFYVLTGLVGIALVFSGITACNRLSSFIARLPWNRQPTMSG